MTRIDTNYYPQMAQMGADFFMEADSHQLVEYFDELVFDECFFHCGVSRNDKKEDWIR